MNAKQCSILKTDARDGNWYVHDAEGNTIGVIVALHHGSSKTTAYNQAESALTGAVQNFEAITSAAEWLLGQQAQAVAVELNADIAATM